VGKYDFVGRYETISEEANYLLDQWGIRDVRFPAGRMSTKDHGRLFYAAYSKVPEDLVEAVYSRFRADFDMFGYSKFPTF
jgi:hypothetical protein